MVEFLEVLFGGMTLTVFLAYLVWAYCGLLVNSMVDILSRDKDSDTSPEKFSWKYWWKDNSYKIIISVVLVPIFILLFGLLFGTELNMLNAFFIGFAGDNLIELLRRRNIITNANKR